MKHRMFSVQNLPSGHALRVPRWKRITDVCCILAAFPVLIPLLCLIAIVIKVVSSGPIFFRQKRIGFLGKPFICWKFRTMRVNADPGLHQSHLDHLMRLELPMTKMDYVGDPRLIPLGFFLRASGLDELPQLINVLRGEMSLVGPRPCLPYEYDAYLPWQKQRLHTLPGLTGLWQVSGKNKTTFTEMVRLDISYARNRSLWLDVKIMARTVFALIAQVREAWTAKCKPALKKSLQTEFVRAEN